MQLNSILVSNFDVDMATGCRQRTIFDRIGDQLMKEQRDRCKRNSTDCNVIALDGDALTLLILVRCKNCLNEGKKARGIAGLGVSAGVTQNEIVCGRKGADARL